MFDWFNRSIKRLEEEQRRFHDFLLEVDSGERRLALPGRMCLYVMRVLYYACKGFWYDDGFSRAAGLAYSVLCSLIPLVLLLTYVLCNQDLPFDIHGAGLAAKEFLVDFIAPTGKLEVQQQVTELTDKLAAKRDPFGFIGLGFLLIIAWSFLNMLEGALNHIWKVASPPIRLGRFPAFLLILALGATTIGLILLTNMPPSVAVPVKTMLPWLTVGVVFFLILYLVPNTRVRPLPVLVFSLLGTVTWKVMEWGYALYLNRFIDWSSSELFGKLGLIPVMLLWIYLTACLLLFCAECTYVSHHFAAVADRRFRIVTRSRFFREYLSIRILLALGDKMGQPMPFRRLIRRIPVPESEIRLELLHLARIGLVQYRLFKGYVLKKEPGDIMLRTLLHLGRHGLEQLRLVKDKTPQGQFCLGIIERIVANASSVPANRTLADVLKEFQPEEPEEPPVEEPTVVESPAEVPPAEDPLVEEPTAVVPPAEVPPAGAPLAEEPTAEESLAEEPLVEPPPASDPPAEEPPSEASQATDPPAEEPEAPAAKKQPPTGPAENSQTRETPTPTSD